MGSRKKVAPKRMGLNMLKTHYVEAFGAKKGKKLPKRLLALIEEAADDINHHFKYTKNPWPLDATLYKSDVVSKFVGFDIHAEILRRLNRNIQIEIDAKGIRYKKDAK